MAKLWMGRIKVDSNCKVLEQIIKTDYLSNTLLKDFNGCSYINGEYLYNYSDNNNNLINKFDVNKIRMIFPPATSDYRIEAIKRNLDIMDTKDIKEYNFVGYWIDKEGNTIREYNKMLEFNSSLSDIRLNYFISVMEDLKYEYKQEATALMVEDALILI